MHDLAPLLRRSERFRSLRKSGATSKSSGNLICTAHKRVAYSSSSMVKIFPLLVKIIRENGRLIKYTTPRRYVQYVFESHVLRYF